jgi:hypothetical protein
MRWPIISDIINMRGVGDISGPTHEKRGDRKLIKQQKKSNSNKISFVLYRL